MSYVQMFRTGPFAAVALAASGLLRASGQDLFVAQKPQDRLQEVDARLAIETDRLEESFPVGPRCPPLKWIKQDFGSGQWILNSTDSSWGAYLEFLGMAKEKWPVEFHASDIHRYAFFDESFMMNHTIPLAKFHLLYETPTKGEWVHNPYPSVTPSGIDPHATVNLTTFRNQFEHPGVPHRDSCWALRTDMPVSQKRSGVTRTFIVTFWRELTSPTSMRCTLRITDADTGSIIEPWATQMQDSSPFPGYSYRYFRKTVQSYDEAALRLPCAPTGIRDGTYFC